MSYTEETKKNSVTNISGGNWVLLEKRFTGATDCLHLYYCMTSRTFMEKLYLNVFPKEEEIEVVIKFTQEGSADIDKRIRGWNI